MARLAAALLAALAATTAVEVWGVEVVQTPGPEGLRPQPVDAKRGSPQPVPQENPRPPAARQASPATVQPPPLAHWPRPPEASAGPLLPPELAREGQLPHAPPQTPRLPSEAPLFRRAAYPKEAAEPPTHHSWWNQWLSRHATDLLILTSASFLLPAQRAGRRGLNWISFLFATQAVVCGVYHYCDQHRVGTLLDGPQCSDATYRSTHLADHGLAYFVMLQMGFLMLGPEDPLLQRLTPQCCRTSTAVAGLPLHMVAVTRAVPGGLFGLLLWTYAKGDHTIGSPAFHVALGLLCCTLLFPAKSFFWMLCPAAAARALTLPQSWLRLLLCLASVSLSSFLFLGMQAVASDATKVGMGGAKAYAHCLWHVAVALLAVLVLEALGSSHFAYRQAEFEGLLHTAKDDSAASGQS